MNPTVSVIMPAYNAQNTITLAIDSILAQTMRQVELIVIDDASTDDTSKILKSYEQKDQRIRVVQLCENGGCLHARKTGIREAKGEYIMFLDSDDLLLPNACARAVDRIRRANSDIFCFGAEFYASKGEKVSNEALRGFYDTINKGTLTLAGDEIVTKCYAQHAYTFTVWNKIFKTELCVKAVDSLPQGRVDMGDDLVLYFAIAYEASKFSMDTSLHLYRYHIGGGISTSAAYTREQMLRWVHVLDAVDQVRGFLDDRGAPGTMEPAYREIRTCQLRQVFEHLACYLRACSRKDGAYVLLHCLGLMTDEEFCAGLERYFGAISATVYPMLREIFQGRARKDRSIRTIGTYYHRIRNGGVERVISQLIPIWTRMGYCVVLLTDEDAQTEDYPIDAPYERVTLPSGDESYRNFGPRAAAIQSAIRQYQIDVIVDHGWCDGSIAWDMLAAKLAGCDFCVHSHLSITMMKDTSIDFQKHFIQLPQVFAQSDGMLTLNSADDVFWQNSVSNVMPVNNPLWLRPKKQPSPKKRCRKVLWIARISDEKRPLDAARIMANIARKVTDAEFYMVGGGDDANLAEKLEKQIEDDGMRDRIRLVGFCGDVAPYYEQCDLMLMTSRVEGYSMTLRESAAFGMPTVMYDLPYLFLRETDAGVRRVRQRDTAAAADAIVELMRNDLLFSSLSQCALWRAQEDAAFDCAAAWKAFFENVERGRNDSELPLAQEMADDCRRRIMRNILEAPQGIAAAQNVNYGTRYYFKHMVAAAMLRVLGEKRWKKLYGAYAARRVR